MDKVHASNGKAPLARLPLLPFFIPSEVLRKVLIEAVVGFWDRLIGLEPSCKSSVFVSSPFQNVVDFIMGMEEDCLLILKMDGEAIDCRLFHVHVELKYMPAGFNRTNVATINVFLDFIHLLVLTDLYCGEIMALVDVLVDILDGLD
jgi:hypothetical protein